MSHNPWFPRGHYGTKNRHETIAGIGQGPSGISGKKLTPFGKNLTMQRLPDGRRQYPEVFTQEELAAKRKLAIEQEALKKAMKEETERKKKEEAFIQLGKAVCSLTPEDFGLFDRSRIRTPVDCTGDEVVATVLNFASNMKKLIGNDSRKTILGNTTVFTGALCSVSHKSVIHVGPRVERMRRVKQELAKKEEETKAILDERWIEIGKAITSITIEDFEISVLESLSEATKTSTSDLAEEDAAIKNKSPEEFDKNNIEEKEKESHDDDDDDDEDFEPRAKRRRSKSKKALAWRGEDVVANVFHFATAVRSMMGDEAKHTCLRSPFDFTSTICNVAQKSVRDRHTVKKTTE